MSTTDVRSRVRGLTEAVRVRVRLRTRLRRVREAWRRRFPPALPAWPDHRGEVPSPPEPATAVAGGLVTVAATAASPRGRQRYEGRPPAGELRLHVDGAGAVAWRVARASDGVTVVAGRVGDPLDDRQLSVLARLGALHAVPPLGEDPPAVARTGAATATADEAPPAAWAQLVAQLAVTGVVLSVPARSGRPLDLLAPDLSAIVRAPLPPRGADPLAWETRSVRQRRAALRGHGIGLADPPAVTALLVTKRPHLIADAVATMAAQTYHRLEIVVGVHGPPGGLPESDLETGGRPLRVVRVPESRNLGEALAEATAAATGRLVTKVDDDDHYGAEHVWDLVMARHYTGAAVVGKGSEFVYLEPKDLTVRRRMGAEFFTDTVAGGTIMLSREDLAAAGGWPPVPRWVDRALLDRMIEAGGKVYRTHPLGFVYTRHGEGHTWDAGLEYFLRDPVRKWRGLPPYDEFADPRRERGR